MNDWRKYDSVFLDSVWQTEKSLRDLPAPHPEWKKKLYQFLLDWFDQSNDFILQKTSGSTGSPKNIKIPKDKLINSALMTGRYFNLMKDQNALLCLSTDYIGGKMMVIRAMVWGMNLICLEPSNHCLDKLQHLEDISFAAMVPSQLFHSHFHPKFHNIKKVIVGGAPVSDDLLLRIADCSTEIFATYGMTETVSHIALRKLNGRDATDIYEVLPDIKINLQDNDCLAIDAPKLNDEYVLTRDLVEVVTNKSFRYLGRLDNVINSGGVKIIPELVEEKLRGLIDEDFIIAALPDPILGEQVVLLLEGNALTAANRATILSKSKDLLSKYEVPKRVISLPSFIRTETGKLRRGATLQLLDNQ